MNRNSSRKRAAQVATHALDGASDVLSEVFERADGLVATAAQGASSKLHDVEKQVQLGIRHTRSRLDGWSSDWPAGARQVATYVRRHPWQATGLCVGAGIVAALVAGRSAQA